MPIDPRAKRVPPPPSSSSSCSSLIKKPLLRETSPLMLRDFLLDDFSSCSSNGFKSFPRRQCCPAAPPLLRRPIHLLSSNPPPPPPPSLFRRSTTFRKASVALIKAIKSLPFGSRKKSLRLSRKLLRKSLFWRRDGFHGTAAEDAASAVVSVPTRWRSFREFLEEQDHTAPPPPPVTHTSHGGGAPTARISTSSNTTGRSNNSKSDSSAESEFTVDTGGSGSYRGGGSSDGGKNYLPASDDSVSERVAVTAGEESTTTTTTWSSTASDAKPWPNDKEQFSPVSVLDCPFKDQQQEEDLEEEEEEEEEEVNSPFHPSLVHHLQGARKKLKKNVRRFDCLDQLQPLNLQHRIAVIEQSSSSQTQSPSSSSSSSSEVDQDQILITITSSSEDTATTKDPLELLSIVKERAATSSKNGSISKPEELLLLDLFEDRLLKAGYEEDADGDELLKEVEGWVKGEPKELLEGWEVMEGRNVYLKDMEENGGWRNHVIQGKEEMGLEMEYQILASLIHEVLELC